MSEVWFYHLQRSTLESALPPLLEKCLQRGWRALVCGTIDERLEALDQALWTYRDDSFLPHGLDGRDPPAVQPVLFSRSMEPKNGAQALFLVDSAALPAPNIFARASVLFDGRDDHAVAAARLQWKEASAGGAAVAYWKESEAGRWEKQG